MKLLVFVKVVPDTNGDRPLDLHTGLADRAASESVLDEIGERALEAAISHAETEAGSEVVAVCVGPTAAAPALRRALALGAASAVHVDDERLAGADLGRTAEVISAAARHLGFDLVVTGNQSTDGSGGVIPAMVAELLELPHLTSLHRLAIAADAVTGSRVTDAGSFEVRASLPAVVSVTEALPDPRVPNFKGIMSAKKKPLHVLTLDDLGIDADETFVPRSIMLSVADRPRRSTGVKIIDEGDAGARLADFLVDRKVV